VDHLGFSFRFLSAQSFSYCRNGERRALGVSLSKLATSASAGVALGRWRCSGRSARSGAPAGARNARDRCAIDAVLGKPRARDRHRRPKPFAGSGSAASRARFWRNAPVLPAGIQPEAAGEGQAEYWRDKAGLRSVRIFTNNAVVHRWLYDILRFLMF
jgi:hypothetical protein